MGSGFDDWIREMMVEEEDDSTPATYTITIDGGLFGSFVLGYVVGVNDQASGGVIEIESFNEGRIVISGPKSWCDEVVSDLRAHGQIFALGDGADA